MGRISKLLPAGVGDESVLPGGPLAPVAAPPAGGGVLSGAVVDAGLGQSHSAVRHLDKQTTQVVAAAVSAGVAARERIELLRDQTRADVSAILPLTNSSAGLRLLV